MLHQHRSSKRPVALTIVLALAAISAVCAQSYGYAPTVHYGGYGPVAPTHFPSYTSVEPTYYYPAPATYGPVPVEPTYFYAAPTAYGTPAPYYYTSPVAPTTPYGSPMPGPMPVYYYSTPVAPTIPYGGPVPVYYYSAPVAPTTPYGGPMPGPMPVYYYSAPVAPTTPYGGPMPVYYYSAPVAPTTPYGGPMPGLMPVYYYSAPVAPTTPYGGPVPSVCPPCPQCSANATMPVRPSYMSIAGTATTQGTCYCPYDSEWNTWAIGDSSCRSSLYAKCKSDARLSCSWLDSYFSPNSTHADDFTRENEGKIQAYLYNDCTPSPPCGCSTLQFSSKDTPAAKFQCCTALKVYAKVPYSALGATDVNAYCEADSVKAAARISDWVRAQLWHTDCSAAATSVYTYKKDSSVTTTAAATPAVAATSSTTTRAAASSGDSQKPTIIAGVVGAVGGAALAVAAAAGWVAYRNAHPRYNMV